jgi:3-oxoacyl-[acyl-carrier-protein] synthase III
MATATPDMPVASTGVYVATEIGATNAFAYDLQPVPVFIWNVNCSCTLNRVDTKE